MNKKTEISMEEFGVTYDELEPIERTRVDDLNRKRKIEDY